MIALSAGSLYSYGLNRAFELAAEAGFDGIEIIIDERWDTRQPEYLSRLSSESGIPVVSFHAPFSAELYGWEKNRIWGVEETVRIAESLQARTVVLHLPLWFENNYAAWLKDSLPSLREKTAVTIAVENLPSTFMVPRFFPRDWHHWRFQTKRLQDERKAWLLPIVRLVGRPVFLFNNLAQWETLAPLAFDTTHLATGGFDIIKVYHQLRDKIAHVHLSNYDRREHALPQRGELPLGKLLTELGSNGFPGVVTMELNPQSLDAVSEKKVKKNLRDSLAYCRQYYG